MAGTPCSAAYVEIDGAVELLGVMRQLIGERWLGADGFQFAGSIGPLSLPGEVLEVIGRIGQTLADRFELIGLFGIDFILEAGRVWTLEVNPRYTASMEVCERATGINAIAAHAAGINNARVNGLRASTPVRPLTHGKAILFAKRDVVISESFAAMAFAEACHEPWPTLADVSSAGTPIEAGRPVLSVFADGATDAEVENKLRERIEKLDRLLYSE